MAKIDPAVADAILTANEAGESMSAIAGRLGLTEAQTYIRHADARKRRRRAEGPQEPVEIEEPPAQTVPLPAPPTGRRNVALINDPVRLRCMLREFEAGVAKRLLADRYSITFAAVSKHLEAARQLVAAEEPEAPLIEEPLDEAPVDDEPGDGAADDRDGRHVSQGVHVLPAGHEITWPTLLKSTPSLAGAVFEPPDRWTNPVKTR